MLPTTLLTKLYKRVEMKEKRTTYVGERLKNEPHLYTDASCLYLNEKPYNYRPILIKLRYHLLLELINYIGKQIHSDTGILFFPRNAVHCGLFPRFSIKALLLRLALR